MLRCYGLATRYELLYSIVTVAQKSVFLLHAILCIMLCSIRRCLKLIALESLGKRHFCQYGCQPKINHAMQMAILV